MALIPREWRTGRLLMRDASTEEVPRLTAVVNACSYVSAWDETFAPAPESEVETLVRRSITSRGGTDDLFTMQSIRTGVEEEIIGYFHLIYNRPEPRLIGISMFVIHPDHQRHGYGREVLEGMIERIDALGAYDAMVARVYLKNWPAMQHWVRMGFTGIMRYEGDPVMTDGASAALLLRRELTPRPEC